MQNRQKSNAKKNKKNKMFECVDWSAPLVRNLDVNSWF